MKLDHQTVPFLLTCAGQYVVPRRPFPPSFAVLIMLSQVSAEWREGKENGGGFTEVVDSQLQSRRNMASESVTTFLRHRRIRPAIVASRIQDDDDDDNNNNNNNNGGKVAAMIRLVAG